MLRTITRKGRGESEVSAFVRQRNVSRNAGCDELSAAREVFLSSVEVEEADFFNTARREDYAAHSRLGAKDGAGKEVVRRIRGRGCGDISSWSPDDRFTSANFYSIQY